jgi:hypothetical protein
MQVMSTQSLLSKCSCCSCRLSQWILLQRRMRNWLFSLQCGILLVISLNQFFNHSILVLMEKDKLHVHLSLTQAAMRVHALFVKLHTTAAQLHILGVILMIIPSEEICHVTEQLQV